MILVAIVLTIVATLLALVYVTLQARHPAPALNPLAIQQAAGNIEAFCRDGFAVFTVNVTSWSRLASQQEVIRLGAYYHQEGGLVVGRGLQVHCLDAANHTHEVYDLCEGDVSLASAYAKALSKATGARVSVGKPLTYHSGIQLAA